MMLKVDFQNLSTIEIFRKSKDREWMLIWTINMIPWCYIWCWKQHSIIVAGFQQNCCFSATNVDYSAFYFFIHAKSYKWWKKTTILLFSINNSNRGFCWWLCRKSAFGTQTIGESRFWTESENWFWAPHMLPWIRLKWYYKLATYWLRYLWQKFLSKFLPPPRALGRSIFIYGADFFHLLIKSTIFGNKNNFCCF